jgi:lipoic acid synthetase
MQTRMGGWMPESRRMYESVALMGLNYIVLTSVNRDDLADGGASHFAAYVRAFASAVRTPWKR